jgi:hypothetical protein
MKEKRERAYTVSTQHPSVIGTATPGRHLIRQQLRDGSNSRMGHRERGLREKGRERERERGRD